MSDFNNLLDTMDELTEEIEAIAGAEPSPATAAEIASKVPDLVSGARARQDALDAILAELAKVDKEAYFGSTGLIETARIRQIIEEHVGD